MTTASTQPSAVVHCRFVQRRPSSTEPGKFHFESVNVDGPHHPMLPTVHPPKVDDHVDLDSGVYRVVARSWIPPRHRSGNWPANSSYPTGPTLLEVIVEESPGLYIDEAAADDPGDEPTSPGRLA